MYTAAEVEALRDQLKNRGASKAEIVQALSAACLGWPYVFGAWGCLCTPENRRTYASRCRAKHADYADKIVKACPVLSGKQRTCEGCPWNGVRCFDCRGFPHWLLQQVGLQLYGDTVTSQWEQKSNWAVQGDIASMPPDLVCCIFRKGHTGMYLGGGITRHCSTIVKEEPMPGNPKWQRWGIPAGLYSTSELRKAGLNVNDAQNIPTLRRGAEGDLVKTLQERLNAMTDAGLTVDGKFGAKTEAAVIHFQGLHDLTDDGIVGPKTWAALGVIPGGEEPEQPDTPPEDGTVAVPRQLVEAIADALEDMALDLRGYLGGMKK